MNKVQRYGAYGVIVEGGKILLTLKKKGPYEGLWDLPGGQIEFGETPEEALHRELLEETALTAAHLELLTIATYTGGYFHHIGIIYLVSGAVLVPGLQPEEEERRVPLEGIDAHTLTPLTRQAVKIYGDSMAIKTSTSLGVERNFSP